MERIIIALAAIISVLGVAAILFLFVIGPIIGWAYLLFTM